MPGYAKSAVGQIILVLPSSANYLLLPWD